MPVIRQRQSRRFKDISLSFKRHPVTNDILALTNEDAIKRSIRNLVETVNDERFFNPLIGSHVRESLFKLADNGLRATLKAQIRTTIENFEPRVNNVKVQVDPRPDDNSFDITIFFDIVGQGLPTQNFSFILEATR